MSDDEQSLTEQRLDMLTRATDRIETILGVDGDAIKAADQAAAGDDVHSRLDDVEQRLAEIETQLDAIQDLGREKTTKEEKIAAIVRYAQNTGDGDGTTGRVALTVKTLRGVTGISRRYAYDYIDDLPQEFEWLHNRSTIDQYGSLEISRDGPDRALIVDLEALHNDEAAVNKFTTRTTGKEASA